MFPAMLLVPWQLELKFTCTFRLPQDDLPRHILSLSQPSQCIPYRAYETTNAVATLSTCLHAHIYW